MPRYRDCISDSALLFTIDVYYMIGYRLSIRYIRHSMYITRFNFLFISAIKLMSIILKQKKECSSSK